MRERDRESALPFKSNPDFRKVHAELSRNFRKHLRYNPGFPASACFRISFLMRTFRSTTVSWTAARPSSLAVVVIAFPWASLPAPMCDCSSLLQQRLLQQRRTDHVQLSNRPLTLGLQIARSRSSGPTASMIHVLSEQAQRRLNGTSRPANVVLRAQSPRPRLLLVVRKRNLHLSPDFQKPRGSRYRVTKEAGPKIHDIDIWS